MTLASKEKFWPPGVHRRHPRIYYKRRDAAVADLHPSFCVTFDAGLPGETMEIDGGQAGLPNELPFARPDPRDPGRFEIICGPGWLQTLKAKRFRDAHSVAIRARIAELTDEEAFLVAFEEIPKRQKLSPFDLGQALSRATADIFNFDYVRLARLLELPVKELKALVELGRLPDEIVAAVADPGALTVQLVEPLLFRMRTTSRRAHVLARAADIAEEQAERRRRRRKLRAVVDVLDDLCEQIPASEARPSMIDVQSFEGKVVARVIVKGEGTGSIDLLRQKGVPPADRHAALLRAIDILEAEVDRPFRFRR